MYKEHLTESLGIFCEFVLGLLLLAMLMSGCTKKVYVPVKEVHTEYRDADTTALFNRIYTMLESRREKSSRTDSLIDRTDKTIVINLKGDTIKETKTKYVYRSSNKEKELIEENKTLRDSISFLKTQIASVKTDSIPLPYPVKRELSRWEQVKIDFGGYFVLVILGLSAIIVWLIKRRM